MRVLANARVLAFPERRDLTEMWGCRVMGRPRPPEIELRLARGGTRIDRPGSRFWRPAVRQLRDRILRWLRSTFFPARGSEKRENSSDSLGRSVRSLVRTEPRESMLFMRSRSLSDSLRSEGGSREAVGVARRAPLGRAPWRQACRRRPMFSPTRLASRLPEGLVHVRPSHADVGEQVVVERPEFAPHARPEVPGSHHSDRPCDRVMELPPGIGVREVVGPVGDMCMEGCHFDSPVRLPLDCLSRLRPAASLR